MKELPVHQHTEFEIVIRCYEYKPNIILEVKCTGCKKSLPNMILLMQKREDFVFQLWNDKKDQTNKMN
jgi:hypothetical protein